MSPEPRLYPGVMVSSTFKDLEQHRAALIRAINGQQLKHVAMEDDSAKPDVDVIESSLQMVQQASAYIGVISHKYGQTPKCPDRNPKELSLTELEFNEAQRLERPILLFIMGDRHPLTVGDVEADPVKNTKLRAFRERAKKMKPGSDVHRVYALFDSLEDFTAKAIQSVAELRRSLDQAATKATPETPSLALPSPVSAPATGQDPIPTPPELYAEPRYLGSHKFLGRQAQLDVLNDWASPADPHNILLFDAIGGSGKSMLTWEWTNNHAPLIRPDWAGRFWYSFYERGAVMADFCRCALAYITGSPRESFNKMKTPEMAEKLLHHLQDHPWLFVLDGLERVLVAYHRFDASDVPDEEANQPTDQIAHRDPCAAIRPEDDDLLRALASAAPSKVLITSRLVPRILLNPALQPIPGVLRLPLSGLRPADAEALLRSCGIKGDSAPMQSYLKTHCDCHPLVTGVLAGLINDYLPDRGNFDSWADSSGGNQLNFADLNLVQKRNHILKAAIHSLDPRSRELLSILALLSEAADYPTLSALNPHLPPEPEEVEIPRNPKDSWRWERMADTEKEEARKQYQAAVGTRREYEQAVKARRNSPEAAPTKLMETVHDLERRGLVQYDHAAKRHDLHPVVRAVAVGDLRHEETDSFGRRVVDHFSQQTHRPYEEAETLEDVRDGVHVVRTLIKMGRHQEAVNVYSGALCNALLFNLEAAEQALSLLRPLFEQGWTVPPDALHEYGAAYVTTSVGLALEATGETGEALRAQSLSLGMHLRNADWIAVCTVLLNISDCLDIQNRLARAESSVSQSLDLAIATRNEGSIFRSRLELFYEFARRGRWIDAQSLWDVLDPMGRNWGRSNYRPGDAEYYYATFCFWHGSLTEECLAHAEELAKTSKNRWRVRGLYRLRGMWQLEQSEWLLAAENLSEAVAMARAVSQPDMQAETGLALARFHLGKLPDSRSEAHRLASLKSPAHTTLAELWLAIGDHEQARKHVLHAYKWAWADGEPYVWRYDLNKSRALLEKLGTEIPSLPPYDPAKREKFPWEDDLVAAIEKLHAEKEAEAKKKQKK